MKQLRTIFSTAAATIGLSCALAAIAVAPANLRLPGFAGGPQLPLTECLLLGVIVLRGRRILREDILSPSLICFLFACALSALRSRDLDAALPELLQISVLGAGGMLCMRQVADDARRRAALVAGLCAGVAVAMATATTLLLQVPVPLSQANPYSLACSFSLYAMLLLALTESAGGTRLFLACAAAVLLLMLHQDGFLESSSTSWPQRRLEAFAALGVLQEQPLFGFGPGTYQQQIGALYHGLPKDNTMRPGTQSGYGVLLVSMGLLGVSTYLYWLLKVSRRVPLLAALLVVWTLLTPPLLGAILLPLGLATGMAKAGERAHG